MRCYHLLSLQVRKPMIVEDLMLIISCRGYDGSLNLQAGGGQGTPSGKSTVSSVGDTGEVKPRSLRYDMKPAHIIHMQNISIADLFLPVRRSHLQIHLVHHSMQYATGYAKIIFWIIVYVRKIITYLSYLQVHLEHEDDLKQRPQRHHGGNKEGKALKCDERIHSQPIHSLIQSLPS